MADGTIDNLVGSMRAVVVTPSGRGAVAVVIVEGVDAARLVGDWFRPALGKELSQRAVGRIVFGRWGANDVAGEEVVACRRSQLQVEVHCHGGAAAAARILDDLAAAGASIVDWRAWRQRQSADAIAAEADVALARATTERTAGILLDQRNGALQREVERAVEAINGKLVEQASAIIAELCQRSRVGRRLVEPWRIVLAGPPNVGKSSLINALLGYERAIVFDHPGTTRDVVTATTAFDGWPCELSDTAGLREAGDVLEQAGIERARTQIATVDLVVLVAAGEAGAGSQEPGEVWTVDSGQPEGLQVIRVWNKCDLLDASVRLGCCDTRWISAKTGEGLGELAEAMIALLVGEPPLVGAAVPFTQRQVGLLERAAAALSSGTSQLALEELAKIVGKSDG